MGAFEPLATGVAVLVIVTVTVCENDAKTGEKLDILWEGDPEMTTA